MTRIGGLVEQSDTYFFIHVMKTSGTSFVFYMHQALGRERVFPGEDDGLTARLLVSELEAIPPRRRESIRGYTGHFPAFAAEIVGATRTVTILRDPVERTISMLKQHQRLKAPDLPLAAIYEDPSVFGRFLDNVQTKVFAMDASDRPESFADVVRIDRARLDAAKERLASVDLIGFQEDHRGVTEAAQRLFGWPPPEQTWWAFVSPKADVPDGLRERIAEDMTWDRELYDFATHLVAERLRPASP